MTYAFVSIGSNLNRERSVQGGLACLEEQFGELTISPIYDTPAVGFDGPPFLNLVVGFESDMSCIELIDALRTIETDMGRDQSMVGYVSRTLDLDLLLYGDLVRHDDEIDLPRSEITSSPHILRPLCDLRADLVHPETGLTFGSHWREVEDSLENPLLKATGT